MYFFVLLLMFFRQLRLGFVFMLVLWFSFGFMIMALSMGLCLVFLFWLFVVVLSWLVGILNYLMLLLKVFNRRRFYFRMSLILIFFYPFGWFFESNCEICSFQFCIPVHNSLSILFMNLLLFVLNWLVHWLSYFFIKLWLFMLLLLMLCFFVLMLFLMLLWFLFF